MFCSQCGRENADTEILCVCGNRLAADVSDASGKATASLVLGIVGMFAWFIPIVGAPVNIVGLVMGVKGLNSRSRGMAIAGVVLCIIGLVLSVLNAALGVYLASTGEYQLPW